MVCQTHRCKCTCTYSPNSSHISSNTHVSITISPTAFYAPLVTYFCSIQDDFLRAPLTNRLQEVPGIGRAVERRLSASHGGGSISTTTELISLFLSLRQPGDDATAHCNSFYTWLTLKKVHWCRHDITRAIAAKVFSMQPDLYSA